MHQQLIRFNQSVRQGKGNIPELQAGDIVKISRKIKEGGKERTQMFQGMIIAVKGGQSSSPTITVRKVSSGVGVELILPVYSPVVEKIEILKRTKARRGKLYYVRTKSAKVIGKKLKEVPFEVGLSKTEVAVETPEVVESKEETPAPKAVEETVPEKKDEH